MKCVGSPLRGAGGNDVPPGWAHFRLGFLSMQFAVFKFLLLLGLWLVKCHSDDHVLALDESNFDQNVFNSSKNAFVKFYAPW